MIKHYLAGAAKDEKNGTSLLDFLFDVIGWTANAFLLVLLSYVVFIFIRALLNKYKSSDDENLQQFEGASRKQTPTVNLSEHVNHPKPRGNTLSLDSVSAPVAKPINQTPSSNNPAPAPATPSPTPTMPESQASSPVSVGPGDFEKSLAQAGQRMDTLLAQTIELTRQLKLSEKAKTDAGVDLGKAVSELKAQIATKDDQIAKLENTLDRKSTYPSLRALLELKKLCLDMIGTQKPLPHDELIAFVTGAIDSQLEKLDIQYAEFPTGTPLDKIPGEQVEVAPRYESTDDPAKHNQVAKLLQPCYFFERDSKRIIIAKALVVLYRLNPPSATTTPPPETPNS
jgi:hypothetical protein